MMQTESELGVPYILHKCTNSNLTSEIILCCLDYLIAPCDIEKWCCHCLIEKLYSYFHKEIWIHHKHRYWDVGNTFDLTQEDLYGYMKQHIQADNRWGHQHLTKCLLCYSDLLFNEMSRTRSYWSYYSEIRIDKRDWFIEYFNSS